MTLVIRLRIHLFIKQQENLQFAGIGCFTSFGSAGGENGHFFAPSENNIDVFALGV
jgi:hypothetical protein